MSNPLTAVARVLYEAHTNALVREWLEVPEEVRASPGPAIIDFDDLPPIDHRLWAAVALAAIGMHRELAIFAARPEITAAIRLATERKP